MTGDLQLTFLDPKTVTVSGALQNDESRWTDVYHSQRCRLKVRYGISLVRKGSCSKPVNLEDRLEPGDHNLCCIILL